MPQSAAASPLSPPTRGGWLYLHDGARLIHARRWPARLDIQAETVLPYGRRGRYARAIRQDMWRLLQKIRGFSPVVIATHRADGVHIVAGGSVVSPVPTGVVDRLVGLLSDPTSRKRWTAYAEPCNA